MLVIPDDTSDEDARMQAMQFWATELQRLNMDLWVSSEHNWIPRLGMEDYRVNHRGLARFWGIAFTSTLRIQGRVKLTSCARSSVMVRSVAIRSP